MTTPVRPAPDEQALDALLGRVVGDLGATMSAPLVVIGDRLGLLRRPASPTPPGSSPRTPSRCRTAGSS